MPEKKTKPKKIVASFTYEKETKNKKRYAEDEEPFAVDKLYIGKPFTAELGEPEKIKVTIEAAQ